MIVKIVERKNEKFFFWFFLYAQIFKPQILESLQTSTLFNFQMQDIPVTLLICL